MYCVFDLSYFSNFSFSSFQLGICLVQLKNHHVFVVSFTLVPGISVRADDCAHVPSPLWPHPCLLMFFCLCLCFCNLFFDLVFDSFLPFLNPKNASYSIPSAANMLFCSSVWFFMKLENGIWLYFPTSAAWSASGSFSAFYFFLIVICDGVSCETTIKRQFGMGFLAKPPSSGGECAVPCGTSTK